MKKIVFIFLFMFLLTGCEINYNLSLDLDSIKEDTKFVVSSGNEYSLYVDKIGPEYEYYNLNDIPLLNNSNNDFYIKKYKYDDDGGFIFNTSGNFDNKSIGNSSIINKFGSIDVNYDENKTFINFSLNSDFFDNYSMVNKIVINVEDSDGMIVSNDADDVNGYIYTWTITKDNPDRSVSFSFNNSNPVKSLKKSLKKYDGYLNNPMIIFSIFLFLIVIVLFIIYKYVFFKYRSNNNV